MTDTGILALLGTPAVQTIVTIGGPRFLLNLRAAYFSSTRNEPLTGFTRSMRHRETEGTVGVFRPAISDLKDEGDDRGGNESGSIEMGIRANSGVEV
ncbi:hypothetical protein FS837_001719 [Tulasnella sp. UAMH 9824]|nr:hypothetical protein FS837_001719 [Tulasnella sp. UAMH 9824]